MSQRKKLLEEQPSITVYGASQQETKSISVPNSRNSITLLNIMLMSKGAIAKHIISFLPGVRVVNYPSAFPEVKAIDDKKWEGYRTWKGYAAIPMLSRAFTLNPPKPTLYFAEKLGNEAFHTVLFCSSEFLVTAARGCYLQYKPDNDNPCGGCCYAYCIGIPMTVTCGPIVFTSFVIEAVTSLLAGASCYTVGACKDARVWYYRNQNSNLFPFASETPAEMRARARAVKSPSRETMDEESDESRRLEFKRS